jgi:hypothetical protein
VIAPARELVIGLQAALRAGTALESHGKAQIVGRLGAAAKVAPAELYVERQEYSACACHAFNAYLGGRAVTTGEFEAWARIVAGGANPAALPPSVSAGFEPFLVQEALEVMRQKGIVDGQPVGLQSISGPAGDPIAAVTLAPVESDRLIVEVQTARDGGRADHYVAFRKDASDRWWLLDSRNEDIANPSLPLKLDGSPIRRPVDPDIWLNNVARNNDLRRVVLIGAGITPTGGHISVEEGVSGAMIKMSGRGIHSL